MKKVSIIVVAMLLTALSACNFNQSAHKDLVTGASSRGNGIACDEVVIQVDGQPKNVNKFGMNNKVNILFENLNGLQKVDGKTFPGLSMLILENEKDTIADYRDLLASIKEGTSIEPLVLNASFEVTSAFNNTGKYQLYLRVWDKKGNGVFTYNLPFTIQ